MYFITSILLLVPFAISYTIPALFPRAGGPAVVPIPANCTTTSIHPSPPCKNFTVTSDFQAAHQVYSIILSEPPSSEQDLWTTCQEQCYGFGNDGDCVSVLLAENVTGEEYGYSVNGLGCLFFGVNSE